MRLSFFIVFLNEVFYDEKFFGLLLNMCIFEIKFFLVKILVNFKYVFMLVSLVWGVCGLNFLLFILFVWILFVEGIK